MKWLLGGVVLLVLSLILLLPWYLGPDDLTHCASPDVSPSCQHVDAIIAVSGGDTPARTSMAVRLYEAGWSSTLIFSGAAQDQSGPSNAAAMKAQAEGQGVPVQSIITDDTSRTTAENASNIAQLSKRLSLKRVILVTSAYHQRRAFIEFSMALGPQVTILNHPVPYDNQWNHWWWLTPQGWWLAGGELIKVIVIETGQ